MVFVLESFVRKGEKHLFILIYETLFFRQVEAKLTSISPDFVFDFCAAKTTISSTREKRGKGGILLQGGYSTLLLLLQNIITIVWVLIQ